MKIENLYEGQVLKNYKALCAELDITYTSGKGKTLQLQDLARYFNYHKNGHQIIIDEIYEEPLPKVDNRGKSEGNKKQNTVFLDTMKTLLLHMLANQSNHRIRETKNKILINMNMINENFSFCSEHVVDTTEVLNINKHIGYDYFNTTRSMLHHKFTKILKQLAEQSLIDYRQVMMVNDIQGHREATDEERVNILKIQRDLLKEMGYDKLNTVRTSKDWKKFKKTMNERLKYNININFHYHAFDIAITEEHIQEEYEKILDWILNQENRDKYLLTLNKDVKEQLINNAKKRKHKQDNKMAKTRKRFDYINQTNYLIENTVSQNATNLKEQIRENQRKKRDKKD